MYYSDYDGKNLLWLFPLFILILNVIMWSLVLIIMVASGIPITIQNLHSTIGISFLTIVVCICTMSSITYDIMMREQNPELIPLINPKTP